MGALRFLLQPLRFPTLSKLLLSARKEWRHLSDNRRIFSNDGLQLVLLLSGGLLVASLAISLERQDDLFRRTNQSEATLLNTRARGFMVTALDWSQRQSTLELVGKQNSAVVSSELRNSAVVRDGQSLLLVNYAGQPVFDSLASDPTSFLNAADRSAVRDCLVERLRWLTINTSPKDRDAFGLLCRLPESLVVGGAARESSADSKRSPLGWVVQYSITHIPAPGESDVSILGGLAPKLSLMSTKDIEAKRPIGNNPKEKLVYFLAAEKPDQAWVLQQPWLISDVIFGAFRDTIFPWATVNLAMLGVILASLSNARRVRLQHRLEQRRSRRLLHNYRILDQGRDLLSLPAFLELAGRTDQAPRAHDQGAMQLLGDVKAKIHTFSSDTDSQISTQASLVATLHERMQELMPEARICRTPDNSLALLAFTDDADGVDIIRALEVAINDTRRKFAGSVRADIRAALTPLVPSIVERQISDLTILNNHGNSDRMVVLLPANDDTLLADMRHKISNDFKATKFAESLKEVHPHLEDVIRIVGNERTICYREMLFRFPKDTQPLMQVQELILALERNNSIHLIDLMMLRKAIDLIGLQRKSRVPLGANLSAQTVQSSRHREEILNLLHAAPPVVRKHLIVEVTETAIIGGPELWKSFLMELGSLGVKVSIDDFGSGYASLSHLFEFHADFIKVDMKYTRMVPNHEVNAMVSFLLSFEANSATRVIMEGIESEEQLRHWLGLGVSHFQGYLFSPPR